ncbi:hypothetical protein XAP412_250096 [Xanthomonas phaseoli pv. phaseoli]|uniref:Uncharacterized protein n=1 Tax=Xanthomonas campestris pv. phaseoli TaxID=317013 RepID=A0AB38E094_XANCH|nr:hypothetical protein XAP6984_310181 [Xanthomonas phaseoli pv. phaseoli]SON82464.1 hypothetical protein XAP412_250096 [Xanthomonas phaseoli pv. phaseoli]SON86590.1 hypothetical protein XAP7430_260180 [Xanthomonas phaseoli pv. phaseoli]SOO27003.1 hypothetical protein XAP6164_1130008 [Xanthomonas phaseoli pv. phaseoli]
MFDHLDEDQGVVEIVSHGMPSGGQEGLDRLRDDYSPKSGLIKCCFEA